jgi:hypothetical protein
MVGGGGSGSARLVASGQDGVHPNNRMRKQKAKPATNCEDNNNAIVENNIK